MTYSLEKINGFVQEHSFLISMSPEHRQIMADGAKIVEFAKGENLFKEGGFADRFFLIRSGRIKLEAHDQEKRAVFAETLGAGDVFGWSWFVAPYSWTLQAQAVEPSAIIVIDGAYLLVNSESNPTFGYALMKRIAALMAHRLHALRLQVAGPV